MKFGESDFGDLLASAEQLTADIDGGRAGDLPRKTTAKFKYHFYSCNILK